MRADSRSPNSLRRWRFKALLDQSIDDNFDDISSHGRGPVKANCNCAIALPRNCTTSSVSFFSCFNGSRLPSVQGMGIPVIWVYGPSRGSNSISSPPSRKPEPAFAQLNNPGLPRLLSQIVRKPETSIPATELVRGGRVWTHGLPGFRTMLSGILNIDRPKSLRSLPNGKLAGGPNARLTIFYMILGSNSGLF